MERTAAGRQMPALDLFGGTLMAENVVVANATNHDTDNLAVNSVPEKKHNDLQNKYF